MPLHAVQAVAPAARFTARVAILLLAFYVLQDVVASLGACFDAGHPWAPERLPFCLLLSYGFLSEGLNKSDLAGRLWHYLPSIVVALAIAVAWTLKGGRRIAAGRTRPLMRFAVLLLALLILYSLSAPASFCLSPQRPIRLEGVPLCFHSYFGSLIEGVGKGGLPGLAWHYLPAIAVSLGVAIVWAWQDRRRARV